MIDTAIAAPSTLVRQPLMSWLSIFGGWLIALGIAWLFYVLGLAVGFAALDVSDSAAAAKGVGIGTTIWVVLTWATSLFLGGMFASWMDGRPDQTIGTLHGVAVWGLAMSVTVLLAAFGSAGLFQGGVTVLRGTAPGGASGGALRAGADTPFGHATGALSAQVRRAVLRSEVGQAANPPTGTGNSPGASASAPAVTPMPAATTATSAGIRPNGRPIDRETMSAVAIDLLRGKTGDATARLAADTGVEPNEAASLIRSLSPQVEKYKSEVKEAADQARRYTAATMWALFFSSLIALVTAALGGWAGAGHIHRVHDQRAYPQI